MYVTGTKETVLLNCNFWQHGTAYVQIIMWSYIHRDDNVGYLTFVFHTHRWDNNGGHIYVSALELIKPKFKSFLKKTEEPASKKKICIRLLKMLSMLSGVWATRNIANSVLTREHS